MYIVCVLLFVTGILAQIEPTACDVNPMTGRSCRKNCCRRRKIECIWDGSNCVDKGAEPRYFLVKDGFNCKNQALDYITNATECARAGRILGVQNYRRPGPSSRATKYCGTVGGMKRLKFNGPGEMEGGLEYASETSFMICKEKESPWADETCGRELCIPEPFLTENPRVFDLSQVVWEPYGGVFSGHILGHPFPEGAALFNMTEKYQPHFHYHTNFHSGWILHGAKKTYGLQNNGADPKYTKPVGTYFAVDELAWHTEERVSPWTIIYLRFENFFDYIFPDPSNVQHVVTPEEAGLYEVKHENSRLEL